MSETFDNLIEQDKEILDTATMELKNPKVEHSPEIDCWCYDGYDRLNDTTTSICMHGRVLGFTWDDGSIFCWLCLLDEVDQGIPVHDKFTTIYSDLEFTRHILNAHLSNGWPEKYTSRLPEDVQYKYELSPPTLSEAKRMAVRHLARVKRVADEIEAERIQNDG